MLQEEHDNHNDQEVCQSDEETTLSLEQTDELFRDPRAKELLIKKLGLDAEDPPTGKSNRTPANSGSGKRSDATEPPQYLTPSGMTTGSWGMPPFFGWPHDVHWFQGMAPFAGCQQTAGATDCPQRLDTRVRGRVVNDGAGPSGLHNQDKLSQQAEDESDDNVVGLLDESEALELIEFDPSVNPKDSWKPPSAMSSFLEKHFN